MTKKIIIETHTDGNYLAVPAMIHYPEGFRGDDSNHWGPNMICLQAMLEKEGFKITDLRYGNGRAIIHAEK